MALVQLVFVGVVILRVWWAIVQLVFVSVVILRV
jgi:hypothetical protein